MPYTHPRLCLHACTQLVIHRPCTWLGILHITHTLHPCTRLAILQTVNMLHTWTWLGCMYTVTLNSCTLLGILRLHPCPQLVIHCPCTWLGVLHITDTLHPCTGLAILHTVNMLHTWPWLVCMNTVTLNYCILMGILTLHPCTKLAIHRPYSYLDLLCTMSLTL